MHECGACLTELLPTCRPTPSKWTPGAYVRTSREKLEIEFPTTEEFEPRSVSVSPPSTLTPAPAHPETVLSRIVLLSPLMAMQEPAPPELLTEVERNETLEQPAASTAAPWLVEKAYSPPFRLGANLAFVSPPARRSLLFTALAVNSRRRPCLRWQR